MAIAENIEGLMLVKGIESQEELAELSGVPQPTISRIIKGISKDPKSSTLDKIAKALDTTAEKLRSAHKNPTYEKKFSEIHVLREEVGKSVPDYEIPEHVQRLARLITSEHIATRLPERVTDSLAELVKSISVQK